MLRRCLIVQLRPLSREVDLDILEIAQSGGGLDGLVDMLLEPGQALRGEEVYKPLLRSIRRGVNLAVFCLSRRGRKLRIFKASRQMLTVIRRKLLH